MHVLLCVLPRPARPGLATEALQGRRLDKQGAEVVGRGGAAVIC